MSLGYAGRKSERLKAQIEFSLASTTRDHNYFFFPNTLITESQGDSPSFIAHEGKHGHQGSEDEKKAELLDAFFASVFK